MNATATLESSRWRRRSLVRRRDSRRRRRRSSSSSGGSIEAALKQQGQASLGTRDPSWYYRLLV